MEGMIQLVFSECSRGCGWWDHLSSGTTTFRVTGIPIPSAPGIGPPLYQDHIVWSHKCSQLGGSTLQCSVFIHHSMSPYSGTSLLGTLWDLDFSPYYRGVLNSEVSQCTTVLHWDIEWCPYYRGFCYLEVCNREVPLYNLIVRT